MSEAEQFRRLAELHRVLKPHGILLVTTHSPDLAYAALTPRLVEMG